jgi:hypothetical protein
MWPPCGHFGLSFLSNSDFGPPAIAVTALFSMRQWQRPHRLHGLCEACDSAIFGLCVLCNPLIKLVLNWQDSLSPIPHRHFFISRSLEPELRRDDSFGPESSHGPVVIAGVTGSTGDCGVQFAPTDSF